MPEVNVRRRGMGSPEQISSRMFHSFSTPIRKLKRAPQRKNLLLSRLLFSGFLRIQLIETAV
jgi:predicted esterase